MQKEVRTQTNEELVKQITEMDQLLNECSTLAMRIKLRQQRTEILQEVQEAKSKSSTLINLLRNSTGRIENHQLAQLNDMAYKAVQKRGLQKKLDERALKNQEFYAKLDKDVEQATKGMKFDELKVKHKEISEFIG